MIRFLLLSTLLACALGNVILPKAAFLDGRIVGGTETTIREHPYQAVIKESGSLYCGGSIIGPRKIVTAAHCCTLPASRYKVQYGVTRIDSNKNRVSVARVIQHPDYNSGTFDYDVCVLLLAANIVFGDEAKSITVATTAPSAGTNAVVTGWGTTQEGGSISIILRKVEVQTISNQQCQNDLGGITSNMLCAGVPEGGKDACQGDSGSPLVAGGKLVGIVSWGYGCARPQLPGVYADAAALSGWIGLQ